MTLAVVLALVAAVLLLADGFTSDRPTRLTSIGLALVALALLARFRGAA